MALVKQWVAADRNMAVQAGFIWDDATNEVTGLYVDNATDDHYLLTAENGARVVQRSVSAPPQSNIEFALPARLAMDDRSDGGRAYKWFPNATLGLFLRRI